MKVLEKHKPPKYIQVRDAIFDWIKSGKFQPQDRIPPEHELAKTFSVSSITIKNALKELEHGEMIYREQGRGTFVSGKRAPRAKVSAETQPVFGLVSRWAREPFASSGNYPSDIIRSIVETSNKMGVKVQIYSTFSKNESIIGMNGLIWISPTSEDINCMRELQGQGLPAMAINRIVRHEGVNFVSTDHQKGGLQATDYLIKLGHENILYVSDSSKPPFSQDRYRGYLEAFRINKFKLHDSQTLYLPNKLEDRYRRSRNFLKAHPEITAVLISRGGLVMPVLRAIQDEGKNIPRDISVVSFDNPLAEFYFDVPFTIMEQPLKQLGKTAVEKLLEIIRGRRRDGSVRILLEGKLVGGKSCRQLRRKRGAK